eukprot:scaffold936_cov106-Amphora_coffeaeformis.AAC.1
MLTPERLQHCQTHSSKNVCSTTAEEKRLEKEEKKQQQEVKKEAPVLGLYENKRKKTMPKWKKKKKGGPGNKANGNIAQSNAYVSQERNNVAWGL